MPHKCTRCGKIYPDGDSRILKGCECGNNTFLYVPKGMDWPDELPEVEESVEIVEEREEVKEEKRDVKIDDFEKIESVRIIAPGMYEIRLENIFNRDGIVIALQEEGRYVIHLPSFLKKKRK